MIEHFGENNFRFSKNARQKFDVPSGKGYPKGVAGIILIMMPSGVSEAERLDATFFRLASLPRELMLTPVQ